MSKHGVWKEYKLTIILGPCQCSAFALNCSRSLFFFFFWFQIKEKGRKARHDRLNWHLKPTLVILHGTSQEKTNVSSANLGRRTNTEKEKLWSYSLQTDVVSASWDFCILCVVFIRHTVLQRRHLRFAVHSSYNVQTDKWTVEKLLSMIFYDSKFIFY